MSRLIHALRWFTRRDEHEARMNAEIEFHIQRDVERLVAAGLRPDEARRRAVIEFGGIDQMREEMREARSGRWYEALFQDVHYGIRVLVRNPGFTLAAVLILALGIGANTAMFSLVYGTLLRPLPYRDGRQLVVVHQQSDRAGARNVPFSVREIEDYRQQNHTLSSVVEHHSMSFLLLDAQSAERVNTAVVSANFFDALGVQPVLGRTFVPDDEKHGAPAVLILSHKYWQTRHQGDAGIVGRTFQMNNRPHVVIGVLPPVPQFPVENDVYMPTSQCPTRSSEAFRQNRQARMMTVFGRLKPDVPLARAQSDLAIVAKSIERANPDAYPARFGYGVRVASLTDELTRSTRGTFLVLLCAAALVLLIACANVANLLLARLLRTQKEIALRVALGASRLRLVRQLVTESVLLSASGALAGLLCVPLAMRVLVPFAANFTARAAEVKVDTPVLLFTLALSLFTGLIFGIAPAFSVARDHASSLRATGAQTTATRGRQRLRGLLVSAQVAVSFTLLIGAGLMTRTLLKMLEQDPGFRADRLLTLRITPNFTHYSDQAKLRVLEDRVLAKLAGSPGVESAALASNFPFNPRGIAQGPGINELIVEGRVMAPGELGPRTDITAVGETYFDTIRQPILSGRGFTGHDDGEFEPVCIINQAMARHLWPNEDAVGRRISFNRGQRWLKIVGIVGDAREYGLHRAPEDEVYLPTRQRGFANNLVIRTSLDPAAVESAVRGALREVDPFLAIDEMNSLERLRAKSVAAPRLTAILLGLFGILALVISAGGIAAVMALTVSQRTQELGIRLALGATGQELIGMMVRQGLLLTALGLLLGALASAGLTRLMSTLLYGVSPADPLTYAAICATLLLVAAAASYIPARRITAIDPLNALRDT
jgi:putative ABC transport system permease protein